MRHRFFVSILISQSACIALTTAVCGQSPASELAAALADAERLRSHDRATTRYLSLYAIPSNRRDEVAAVASYTLNALSRSRAITRPQCITDTLLRFNIDRYTTNKSEADEWIAAWEKIVEIDPYWHIRTEVFQPISPSVGNALRGVPALAQVVATSTRPTERHRGRSLQTVTVAGGWINLAIAARLQAFTGSAGALLLRRPFHCHRDSPAALL